MKKIAVLFTKLEKFWKNCPSFIKEVSRMMIIYGSIFLTLKMLTESGSDNHIIAVISVFYTVFSLLLMQADKLMRKYRFSQEGWNQFTEDMELHNQVQANQHPKMIFSSHQDLAQTMEMFCDEILGKTRHNNAIEKEREAEK
jgi:hypothetical protein